LLGTTITTTQSVFQLNNNALTLTGGGYIPLSAGVTGLYQGTGQVINIHASGQLTGGTSSSTTLAIELYQIPASALPIPSTDSSATVYGLGTAVGLQAAVTLGSTETAGSFVLDAYIQLDAQGNINGYYTSNIFGTTKAQTVITTITGLVGEADLNFLLTATLGGTETGVVINLDFFELNLV
jgi:hypothetical protein